MINRLFCCSTCPSIGGRGRKSCFTIAAEDYYDLWYTASSSSASTSCPVPRTVAEVLPLPRAAFYGALLRTKGEEGIVPIQSVAAVMGMKPLSESGQTAADSDGDIIAF